MEQIGWNANKFSVDGFSPNHGWIKIDLKPLHILHVTYDNKMRIIKSILPKQEEGKTALPKIREKVQKQGEKLLATPRQADNLFLPGGAVRF